MSESLTLEFTTYQGQFQPDFSQKPYVVVMVGVNGSGKTTSLGKMAAKAQTLGARTLIAAGDTFRAAAVEQLKIWAERAGAGFISRPHGADPAGLVFDALSEARQKNYDLLLIDTAGRLENKTGLMQELAKIIRVLKKQDPNLPHEVLLVLDATVGRNGLAQAKVFAEVAGVTGLVMTKLDGTARGGILLGAAEATGLPIKLIGFGEGLEDLQDFDARVFARSLLGLGPS